MAGYKLYYFTRMGRAEYVRYIFAYAGVKYDDIRIEPGKQGEWAELKPKMPFGQLPALEIDGRLYCQSYAICRYLAHTFGLMGSTREESLKVDMIVDCQGDCYNKFQGVYCEKDSHRKSLMTKIYTEKYEPFVLNKFESLLKENGGGEGYFVGDSITFADLAFHYCFSLPKSVMGINTPWNNYPKLKVLMDKIGNDPKIKAWIERRPKSVM